MWIKKCFHKSISIILYGIIRDKKKLNPLTKQNNTGYIVVRYTKTINQEGNYVENI